MKRTSIIAFLWACAIAFACTGTAWAAATPKPSPPLSADEQKFVTRVTADLRKRFASRFAASAAGYVRFNEEDETGAISWVNVNNWKSDPEHPSQLWYDARGHLIGVDISVLRSEYPTAPSLWGVSPSRWIKFGQHTHFVIKTASGTTYGGASVASIRKAGGDPNNPTADDIVKLDKAKSVGDVAFVFNFPAIWSLEFWLVPNPNGAFAESNPNVIPTKSAKSSM
jgi:hypothetical protein